jgi:uncharacterized protein DUF6932
MLPAFQTDGALPTGVHWADWAEFQARFGTNPHRRQLLMGLREALERLAAAGCLSVYINGSFVTVKEFPGDFDACWDITGVDPARLDPVFLDLNNRRTAQKQRFMGEFFPAQLPEGASGRTFLEFFQIQKNSGDPKGIVAIDLTKLHT